MNLQIFFYPINISKKLSNGCEWWFRRSWNHQKVETL